MEKKLGKDVQALGELEVAARQLKPEMVEALTRQAMDENSDILPKIPKIVPPVQQDWFSWVGSSINQFFTGEAPKDAGANAPEPEPFDLMNSLENAYRQSKRFVKSIGKDPQEVKKRAYTSAYAQVMPMDEMLELVDKSKRLNKTSWASHPDGLDKFRQSPESTREWDFWIARFKRSFQYVLLKHLAR
ncbi:MAG: hypothetical protein K8F91_09850, partial [Candidatus Obscuribacterales bacterium]|nr:hypothetical protein [Candidatus Obscuribacterales bacterium]